MPECAARGETSPGRNFTGDRLWACGYALSAVDFESRQIHRTSVNIKTRMYAVDSSEFETEARLDARPKPMGDRL